MDEELGARRDNAGVKHSAVMAWGLQRLGGSALERSSGGLEGMRGRFMTPSQVISVTLRDLNEDSMS